MAATSEAINQFDDSMKKQMESFLRAFLSIKSLKEDKTPCEIDEVFTAFYYLNIHCIFFY